MIVWQFGSLAVSNLIVRQFGSLVTCYLWCIYIFTFSNSCDVPWEGNVSPKYCTPYETVPDALQVLLNNLNQGVDRIHQEGYKLIMVGGGLFLC